MPRELFPCISKQKEQPLKGTPSLPSHACSRSAASRDQLVLSQIFLGNTPNIFPLKHIHPPRKTPCLPKAHQALRASRLKPTTGGSLELLGMTRGSSTCQPCVPEGGSEQQEVLGGINQTSKDLFPGQGVGALRAS